MTILESLPLVLGASMKVSHVATKAAGPSFCYGTDPTAGTRSSGSVNISSQFSGESLFSLFPARRGRYMARIVNAIYICLSCVSFRTTCSV